MVLPAPATPEGQAGRAAWLERIRGILQLGRDGVLILIPDAKPAQLLPLMRTLWAIDAGARVVLDPRELPQCEVGALVVLALREADSVWLNLNRPIFVHRKLRVVLWGDESVVTPMLGRAPDFFDWVSNVIGCPFGVPGFSVRGLRAGIEWGRIAWGGGLDLRAVLKHLRWPFEELPTGSLRLLDSSNAELLEVPGGADGWFPVDARQIALAGAMAWPNLDAAIRCELEPSAVELLARLHAEAISVADIGATTDIDRYLLERAKQLPDWAKLHEQALHGRTSGPLVRALVRTLVHVAL